LKGVITDHFVVVCVWCRSDKRGK